LGDEDLNYIREINAFYDWLETNTISDSAISLWHALMHINNKTGWKNEFSVAMSVLESKTGLKKDAIIRARKTLQKSGRISFKSRTGMQSAVYKIMPLELYVNGASTNCDVLTDTNHNTNRAQSATQSEPQTATQTASIPKQNKTKQKEDILFPEKEPVVTNEEQTFIDVLKEIDNYPIDFSKDIKIYKTLSEKYPNIDVVSATKDWGIYKLENPLQKKQNARSQLNTWCSNAQKWRKNLKSKVPPETRDCSNFTIKYIEQEPMPRQETEKWEAPF